MKIEFTEPVAGARFAYRKGQVKDLPTAVAKEFIRLKQAKRYVAPPEAAAHAGAPEIAVSRPNRLTRLFS